MLYLLSQIDEKLASAVAYNIGVHIPKDLETSLNRNIPADADPERYRSIVKEGSLDKSAALSMLNTAKGSIRTRKIAILAADGVDENNLQTVKEALEAEGAVCEVIAPRLGFVVSKNDISIPAPKSFLTAASVFYDAVYVPGGTTSVATLEANPDAIHFLNEAFKHCKAIAADDEALQVLQATYFGRKLPDTNDTQTALMEGVIIGNGDSVAEDFIKAIAQHRFWDREKARKIPA
jgi:catalase